MKKLRRTIQRGVPLPVALLAGAAALLALVACGSSETGSEARSVAELLGLQPVPPDFVVGGPAPTFELPAMLEPSEDDTIELSAHRGYVVVLNFWGTGCVPCIREHDLLNDVAESYHERGVRFLGIMAQDSEESLARFFDEYSPTMYPNVSDPAETVSRDYRVKGIPVHVVIDRAGTIVWWHVGGPIARSVLEDALDAVLAGERPPLPRGVIYPT